MLLNDSELTVLVTNPVLKKVDRVATAAVVVLDGCSGSDSTAVDETAMKVDVS